jgi:hypothetical protein
MKKQNWFKKMSALELLSLSVLAVSIIMIIAFILNFWGSISDYVEDWGSFGSYFGSITGLLAFLGVLYSLILSEKKTAEAKKKTLDAEYDAMLAKENAKLEIAVSKREADKREAKATEQAVRREERDLFFKLLELHQEKLKSVFYEEIINVGYNGLIALEKYANILNNILSAYSIYDCITKKDLNYWLNIKDNKSITFNDREAVLRSVIYLYSELEKTSIFDDNGYYRNTQDVDNYEYIKVQEHLKKDILVKELYKNRSGKNEFSKYEEIYQRNYVSINTKEMYLGMKLASNIFNEEHGHLLDQYFKNLKFILSTCDKFIYDKKYYFKLYRAQLSRNEILLTLFYSLSDKSNKKFVNLLSSENILDDMYNKDLLFTVADKWYEKEKIFIADILAEYLKEH